MAGEPKMPSETLERVNRILAELRRESNHRRELSELAVKKYATKNRSSRQKWELRLEMHVCSITGIERTRRERE